jgi:hypothetical protein
MFILPPEADAAEYCERIRRLIDEQPPRDPCCDCPCNCPPPRRLPPFCSRPPVRFANGEIFFRAVDLEAKGFGMEWGHTRTYSNRLGANSANSSSTAATPR